MHVVDLTFVICYPVVIFTQRNLFIIALLNNVTRFGVGRLRRGYTKQTFRLLFGHGFSRNVGSFKRNRNPGFLFDKIKKIARTLHTTEF